MKDDVKNYEYPNLRFGEFSGKQSLFWGYVTSVNGEFQTMNVYVTQRESDIKDIPINNSITKTGVGFRMMPIAGQTVVLLLKVGIEYIHIGYALQGLEQFTEDKFGNKIGTILLQRHLEEGEVQMFGGSNNEILLSRDGSILLKTKDNTFIRLDDDESVFESHSRNIKFEMDGVRIRGGNVRRPLRTNTKEDDDMMINAAGDIVRLKDLEETDGELESYVPLKEFLVQVGTQQDDKGLDKPFDQSDPSASSPSVGQFGIGDKLLDETGEPIKILGKEVKGIFQLTEGGGLAVTEDNSLYLLDYGGKNYTKFGAGLSTKSLRSGDNTFVEVSGDQGLTLNHRSRNSIKIQSDQDGYGETTITNDVGRGITVNKMGTAINCDGAYASITAKEINFNAEKVTFGGLLAAVTGDALFKAKLTATAIDLHVHAGPLGPPIVPITPLVLSGAIASTGMNVG